MRTSGVATAVLMAFAFMGADASAQVAEPSPTAPSKMLDPVKWRALVAKISAEGKPSATHAGLYLSLARVVPEDGVQAHSAHRADYISSVGGVMNGHYIPFEVASVSENWQIDADGNWNIDQLLMSARLDGSLKTAMHFVLVETPDAQILDLRTIPMGPVSDQAVIDQWLNTVDSWSTNTP